MSAERVPAVPRPVAEPGAPTRDAAPRSDSDRGSGWIVPVGMGAAALALDVALLPHVPGVGDSAEFTLALAQAGVPHPTGYPVYVLVGHGFVSLLHALGAGWVTAANAWSALGGALAVGLFTALVQRLIGLLPCGGPRESRLGAAIAAGALALNPVWLGISTVAEVQSWEMAWVAGAALLALDRARILSAGGPRLERDAARGALTWGMLCGIGVAHHALSAFFILPLSVALVAVACRARVWRFRLPLFAAAGLVVPLLGMAFLMWRAAHPVAGQWPLEPTLQGVWRHATGAAYRGYLGGFHPKPSEQRLIAGAVMPWLIPGLAGGAWFALRLRDPALRAWLLALLAGATLEVAFIMNYGVPDPASYFAAPLMVAVVALAAIALTFTAKIPRIAVAVAGGVLLIALGLGSIPMAVADARRLERIDQRIRDAWHRVPFERGIVLWSDDHVRRLVLFQALEHDRAGLIVADPILLTWPVARERFARLAGFDPLAGLEGRTPADLREIAPRIARRSPIPVVEFPALLERRAPLSAEAPPRRSP